MAEVNKKEVEQCKGETAIYIGGLDKNVLLKKEAYTEYIKSLVSADFQGMFETVEIGPAFPSMGGLVVTIPTFELATTLTSAMEKNPATPSITMLPYIDPEVTDEEPLLVLFNVKIVQDCNQGAELLSAFRQHLNPHQVWDLSKGGPMPGLWSMRNMKTFRILSGGGDGTSGWVLGALEAAREYLQCKQPPTALLPLGTGNDLARALKWNGGYTGEKAEQILLNVKDADVVHLDRWNVSFDTKDEKSTPTEVVMNNYTGIGLDAAIALDFYLAREKNPEKFKSRLRNKVFYFQLALKKVVQKSDLHRHVTLTVDGNRVELPDIAGLIILNIQSWGAGADLWGTTSDPGDYKPAAYDDGLLEVVGVKGIIHMGKVQSGTKNAIRIAQGREVSINLLSSLPVHVDGEPRSQPPSTMTIKKLPNPAAMLKGPSKCVCSQQPSKKEEEFKCTLDKHMHDVENKTAEEIQCELNTLASQLAKEEETEVPVN